MNIDEFKKYPFMGILRDIKLNMIPQLVDTILETSLKTVEITMNTPLACKCIKAMIKKAGGKLTIGAGTVLTKDAMNEALDAGATFIVSPTLVEDVVRFCENNEIAVFPGAMTPQEIRNAWHSGATMVKVFPAKILGPEYLKEIKGPFKDIELLACGGIKPDNIGNYFACGASAVAFGASVFKKEWLEMGDYKKIKKAIQSLIGH